MQDEGYIKGLVLAKSLEDIYSHIVVIFAILISLSFFIFYLIVSNYQIICNIMSCQKKKEKNNHNSEFRNWTGKTKEKSIAD